MMIPGRIDMESYKQITLQSDYDRNGKLIIAYDDQGDIYVETQGEVRFANISSSKVGKDLKEYLVDLVNHSLSDIPVGTEFEFKGKRFVCQPALQDSQKDDPDNECEGCAFDGCSVRNRICGKFLCIDEERADHTNIMFVEKGGEQ